MITANNNFNYFSTVDGLQGAIKSVVADRTTFYQKCIIIITISIVANQSFSTSSINHNSLVDISLS